MILTKKIKIKCNGNMVKYYNNLGYNVKTNDEFYLNVEDLSIGSKVKIRVKCDNNDCINEKDISYYQYINNTKNYSEKYYCQKCNNIKRKQTCLEKYGYDNYTKTENYKKQTKETKQEKYGDMNYNNREKFNKTCLEKYGNTNYNNREKFNKTCLEKYGTEHISKLISVKEKVKQTCLEKYGTEYYSKTDKYKKNIKINNLKKYGVEHISKLNRVKEKKKIKKLSKILDKYKKIIPKDYFIKSYDNLFVIQHTKCDGIFEINRNVLYDRMKFDNVELCTTCNPINNSISDKENKLYEYIKNNYRDEIEIIHNDRSILNGKELDIYIPSKKLAIEFNGLYWHSELYKPNDYHKGKTELCEQKGISLLHIFEDDWIFKQDIIKSIINNKLGIIENKIYARKCIIKEVKSDKARQFLDNNHIQGFSKSSYKLGLYYNDELVSIMTFGYRRTNSKKEFELIRFCNKINTNVVGAASKLFKHFIKNYSNQLEESYLISYADISLFDGSLYDTLGFSFKHRTKPNYFWVVDNKREHRFKYNKQNLIKEGANPLMTEKEIMFEKGYYRIFGSGQDRYEYYF